MRILHFYLDKNGIYSIIKIVDLIMDMTDALIIFQISF